MMLASVVFNKHCQLLGGSILVAKHDVKKEAKIGEILEAKIGTYLEVISGAKWDAKVVAHMDANFNANMARK